jgi:hypothetical protein
MQRPHGEIQRLQTASMRGAVRHIEHRRGDVAGTQTCLAREPAPATAGPASITNASSPTVCHIFVAVRTAGQGRARTVKQELGSENWSLTNAELRWRGSRGD